MLKEKLETLRNMMKVKKNQKGQNMSMGHESWSL